MDDDFNILHNFYETVIIKQLVARITWSRRNYFLNKHTKTLPFPCKLSTFSIQCYKSIQTLFPQEWINATQLLLSSALARIRGIELHKKLSFQVTYLHIYIFNIWQAQVSLEHKFPLLRTQAYCVQMLTSLLAFTIATLKNTLAILFFAMIWICILNQYLSFYQFHYRYL